MVGLDRRALRVLWTALVFVLAVGMVYLLRRLLVLLAFGVFFAYLLFPLVHATQRRLKVRRRGLAIGLVYVALLGVIVGGGAALVPRLSAEVSALSDRLPEMSQKIQSGRIVGDVLERRGWEASTIATVEQTIRENAHQLTGQAQRIAAATLRSLAGTWVIVLVPIFAFFFLKDCDRLAVAVEGIIDSRAGRWLWRDILRDVDRLLGEYVRALLLLCVITFVVWSGVFFVAGVPYPLLLAAIGGALEFIPVVGPLTAGVIVVAVSLISGFAHPWLLVGFLVLWRGAQDYVTSPLIMSSGVELHPALVIFGVIAGGEVAGVPGMFLSVPVIATLRIVWHRLRVFEKATSAKPALMVASPPTPTRGAPRIP